MTELTATQAQRAPLNRSASVDCAEDIEPSTRWAIPHLGGLVKAETQVTHLGSLLARAIVLALLLLTIGGGVANADSPNAGAPGVFTTSVLPDDPGYELAP